ncbi:hypothetical protein GGF32_004643 [Allomyces javanicus]|nr:hypothetical protein GGF32_004643 [Allomyces javanicus]
MAGRDKVIEIGAVGLSRNDDGKSLDVLTLEYDPRKFSWALIPNLFPSDQLLTRRLVVKVQYATSFADAQLIGLVMRAIVVIPLRGKPNRKVMLFDVIVNKSGVQPDFVRSMRPMCAGFNASGHVRAKLMVENV